MINGIISVIIIFLICAVGFRFNFRKAWPANTPSVLSVLVVKIAAPTLAIISIFDRFTRELLRASAFNLLILLAYTVLLYGTGKIFSKIMHLKGGKKPPLKSPLYVQ